MTNPEDQPLPAASAARRDAAPSVLVTDAGRGSAIAVIRSLGRRGWRVVAADADPHCPAFRSHYTAEQLVYPVPEAAPQEFVQAVLGAVRGRKIDLVIPVTDAAILPLAESRSCFDGLCRLAMPSPAALSAVTDKLQTIELARRLGVPIPATRLVRTVQEALDAAPELGWPMVLKPQVSRLYRDRARVEAFTVSYANDPDRLAREMARLEGKCLVLLQEFYCGSGQGVELLMHEGRPLAAFQHRRLREVPITGGASALRESVPLDPWLYDHSVALLAELRWTGLAMVEFKVGPTGPKLMEINGRIWGSLPLAVLSGMDFPARWAELCLQGPPPEGPPETTYRLGVRARNMELELVWLASTLFGRRRYPFLPAPRRRQAAAMLAQLLHPGYKFDVLSLEDPSPALAKAFKIVTRLASKSISRGQQLNAAVRSAAELAVETERAHAEVQKPQTGG
jgi:predicted ATP-grasp superfamily ATP-dependent carboligase